MKLRPKKSLRLKYVSPLPPPFSGEIVQCEVCHAEVKTDPHISLGWRCIEVDNGKRFFACVECRPADDASKETWTDWLVNFIKTNVASKPGFKPVKHLYYYRETGDGPPMMEKVM